MNAVQDGYPNPEARAMLETRANLQAARIGRERRKYIAARTALNSSPRLPETDALTAFFNLGKAHGTIEAEQSELAHIEGVLSTMPSPIKPEAREAERQHRTRLANGEAGEEGAATHD